ncbi:MAG: NlpC/P60 family protein [Candidatus Neomarinimicrobiota bacterium]
MQPTINQRIILRSGLAMVLLLLPAVPAIGLCQQSAPMAPEGLERVVEKVKATHAPDSRLDLFQIELHREGNQIIVSGAVTDRSLREVLLDSLGSAAVEFQIIDSITVLPSEELQPHVFGIVSVSVANMRRTPSVSAELINQTLLGTVLKLYKRDGGYLYVHNRDRYLGWVSSSSLVAVDSLAAAEWQHGPRVIVTANYGVVRDQAGKSGTILVDLVPGAVLKKRGPTRKWVQVETPDGRVGYVERSVVVDEAAYRSRPASQDQILVTARSYLGIPYLWGGTSTKGFDCSGFVQTVFRMNNIALPRDANQQVLEGIPVEPGEQFENLQGADLLFFGPTAERITHVGIYLGDRQFIHSSGSVRINSLDPEHRLYNEYRQSTLRAVKRIQLN